MKKAIIAILIYFLVLHVFLPAIYYIIYGFTPVYSDLVDFPALIKSFVLLFIPLVLAIIILFFIPTKNDKIKANIDGKPITILFYFSILLKLGLLMTMGGFEATITGEKNGTLVNYITLFLNPFTLLLTLLFVQKKKSNVLLAILFYVISVTLSGSRSGIITIFFVFFIGLAFETFKFYKGKLSIFLKCGIIIAPILFIFATKLRGIDDFVGIDFIFNQIVGRMSVLETSMMPIYYYDNNIEMELFYDKYSVSHQFFLALDSIVPGQLFDFDIMPNNYYRAIFMEYSQSFVLENYMSVNLCLPTYLYLKYGYFTFLLTILYVIGFYKLTSLLKSYPLLVVVLLSAFYNVIYFFDWVMVFTQIYTGILTVLVLKMFVFIRREFIRNIKYNELKN
ncbi:hypothetical protein LPB87_04580 [Flavobacterium sp. EDS]|uniref:hypothetical protein n=1 Tax=Flavobacterium sp. EDS TaxID=2897328 RepID=UPI001E3BE422|nr:hypothetical protein [Flavobacterium sp. EDS]MCD0473667.1 hypothetical protein [Flavobacterium sp. EDS]